MQTSSSRWARRRVVSLVVVHLLIAAHIIHWKLAGASLSSIQLSEAGRFTAEGVVTAAALLLALLLVATAIFGRFFCAWACHMLALQEVCALLLRRCGIRPKPVRSRTLWLVPFAAAFLVYLRPLVELWWTGQTFPEPVFDLSSDDLWANLPGARVGVLTLLTCGLAMVYFLGSLSFCKYVCPYGALFALADRLAFGRIRLTGECDGCARCTAACTTGLRVHEEIQRAAVVADSGCMRCFECVAACPRGVLAYRFGPPATALRRRAVRLPPSFSWPEEAGLLGLFALGFAAFDGLYDVIPLLLALAAAVLFAYAGVIGLRLLRRRPVYLRGFALLRAGHASPAGRAFLAATVFAVVVVLHSLFIQLHAHRAGARLAALDFPRLHRSYSLEERESARTAATHLSLIARYGAVENADVHMKLAWIHRVLREPAGVEEHLRLAVALEPAEPAARFNLGKELHRQGRQREAASEFSEAVRLAPELARYVPELPAPPPVPSGAAARDALSAQIVR